MNPWLEVEVLECGGWICGEKWRGFEETLREGEEERDTWVLREERSVIFAKKSDPNLLIYTLTLALTPLMFLMCFTNTQIKLLTSH